MAGNERTDDYVELVQFGSPEYFDACTAELRARFNRTSSQPWAGSLDQLRNASLNLRAEFATLLEGCGCNYGELTELFSVEQRAVLFEVFFDLFDGVITSGSDYFELARHFDNAQKQQLYLRLKHKIPDLIESAFDFQCLSSALPAQPLHDVFINSQQRLISRIIKGYDLFAIIGNLNEHDTGQVLAIVFNREAKLKILTSCELSAVVQALSPSQCIEYGAPLCDALIANFCMHREEGQSLSALFSKPVFPKIMRVLAEKIPVDELAIVIGRLKFSGIPKGMRGFIVENLTEQIDAIRKAVDSAVDVEYA